MNCLLASAVKKLALSGGMFLQLCLIVVKDCSVIYGSNVSVSVCFSVVNYSVTSVPEASGDGGEFFCVKQEELSYGKKIKDSLYPW